MKQKLLNLGILSFLILAACLCLLPTPVEAMTGTGTIGDPFIISTPADLDDVSDNLTAYYELGGDIDASATVGWNGGLGFKPIGSIGGNFAGHLDGKGYAINDLHINRPLEYEIGLFAGIESPATIQDLILNRPSICAEPSILGALVGFIDGDGCVIEDVTINDLDLSGYDGSGDVGGMIGYWNGSGTFTNCYVIGGTISVGDPWGMDDVGGLIGWWSDGVMSDCYSSVDIDVYEGDSFGVGGLIGWMDGGTVEDCSATGDITGEYIQFSGGLVGWAWGWDALGHIMDCWASGDILDSTGYNGGFIGWAGNAYTWWHPEGLGVEILRCYSTGDVIGIADDDGYNGGFVGWVDADVSISECFSIGDVSSMIAGWASEGWAGFVSWNDGDLADCYSRGDVNVTYGPSSIETFCAAGFCGYFDIGSIDNCYSTGAVVLGGYPWPNWITGHDYYSGDMVLHLGTGYWCNGDHTSGDFATDLANHFWVLIEYGGFIGNEMAPSVTDCFWDVETSGWLTSYGGIGVALGKTTSLMKTESTFTTDNWDFTTIWCMPDAIDNDGYPILQNVLPAGLGWTCYVPYSGNPAAMFETYKQVTGSGKPLWYQALPSILKLLYVGFILLMAVAELRSKPKNQFPTLPDVKV